MEDHEIILDDPKHVIDTFTGEIADDHILLTKIMTCVQLYQKLITHKQNLDSQAERESARATEDKAAAQVKTEDANDYAEVFQYNGE